MLRTTCWTTQHHNPADWNIFYTRFLLVENIMIPCFGCDGVQFDSCRCLRRRNHLHLHGQPWLDTTTPHQTVTHAIPTILPVLFNVCFMACKIVTLLHGFTCFCTQCWDTVVINTCTCIFSSLTRCGSWNPSRFLAFTFLNYASSLPNASIVNEQFIFQFSSKSQTYRNLMRPLKILKNAQNSLWEADCIFKKWSLWMWSWMEQFSFLIKSQQTCNGLRAAKLHAVYPQSYMEFLTILGTTALMASRLKHTGQIKLLHHHQNLAP